MSIFAKISFFRTRGKRGDLISQDDIQPLTSWLWNFVSTVMTETILQKPDHMGDITDPSYSKNTEYGVHVYPLPLEQKEDPARRAQFLWDKLKQWMGYWSEGMGDWTVYWDRIYDYGIWDTLLKLIIEEEEEEEEEEEREKLRFARMYNIFHYYSNLSTEKVFLNEEGKFYIELAHYFDFDPKKDGDKIRKYVYDRLKRIADHLIPTIPVYGKISFVNARDLYRQIVDRVREKENRVEKKNIYFTDKQIPYHFFRHFKEETHRIRASPEMARFYILFFGKEKELFYDDMARDLHIDVGDPDKNRTILGILLPLVTGELSDFVNRSVAVEAPDEGLHVLGKWKSYMDVYLRRDTMDSVMGYQYDSLFVEVNTRFFYRFQQWWIHLLPRDGGGGGTRENARLIFNNLRRWFHGNIGVLKEHHVENILLKRKEIFEIPDEYKTVSEYLCWILIRRYRVDRDKCFLYAYIHHENYLQELQNVLVLERRVRFLYNLECLRDKKMPIWTQWEKVTDPSLEKIKNLLPLS